MRTDSSRVRTNEYSTFRPEHDKIYNKSIGSSDMTVPSSAVKTTILDTGIERSYELIEARNENLKGKHNCYDSLQKIVSDRNGHGTFVASLILDYAPDAESYIIKIADDNARPDAKVIVDIDGRVTATCLRDL